MTPYFSNAGVFLVSVLFGFFILTLMLRTLLQLVRANFFNPVCQFIVKLTNPVLFPLRRALPNWRQVDISAIVVMWVAKIVELLLIAALLNRSLSGFAITFVALVELIDLSILVLLVVIFIQVILSWIAPGSNSPVQPLLYQLSRPILAPLRRNIPPMGGLDFSSLVALIGLQLARMLLVDPLRDLAFRL